MRVNISKKKNADLKFASGAHGLAGPGRTHVTFAGRRLQRTGKLELGPARSKMAVKENLRKKSSVP